MQDLYSKPFLTVLSVLLAVLVSSVVLASLLRWLRRRRQERPDTWIGLITGSLGNVLKVLGALALLILLTLHLRFQSDEYARLHGGTSERNYDAVQMIWGRPHVQRELGVALQVSTKKYYDKDGLEYDPEKLLASTQPVAYREATIVETLPVNPILSSNHQVDLTLSPRQKGTGTYPGFDVGVQFRYEVCNLTDRDAKAGFHFPLPYQQGLLDDLTIRQDGKPLSEKMTIADGAAVWEVPMQAGQSTRVEISYHSRGLGHIRIEPGSGVELRNYKLTMLCHGITLEQVDYPIGCMTPTGQRAIDGGTELTWELAHAVSRFGMGLIMPEPTQEGYYIARVLKAAPWALALLLGLVLVTHLVLGRPVPYVLLVVLAVAFDLYYLLMANLGDYRPGMYGGMAIAGGVVTVLTAWLWFARSQPAGAITTIALLLVFTIAYPLMVVSDDAGLYLSILNVALLAYVTALLVLRARRDKIAAKTEQGGDEAPTRA
jgi:hypothetical protein